jgi:3-oxoacyl-[acyl-carrier protein] reductase
MSDAFPRAEELGLSDISVGDVFRVERTFTAEDVERFARLCGDFSPLHTDPSYASTTEFGGCVVHGMLLASLFSQLVGMRVPGRHALYLAQDLSFRHPVRVGETIKASAKVTAMSEATQTLVLNTEIRNGEDRVVVSGSAKVKVREAGPQTRLLQSSKAMSRPAIKGRRVALVTGAARGIGAEIAKSLAARGISVGINYFRSDQSADRLAQVIRQEGGEALAIQADVRQAEEVNRMVDTLVDQFGSLDLLVNGAIGELNSRGVEEMEWSAFQGQLDYQLKAVLLVCQAAYPIMKAGGGGAIVNLLSQVVDGQPAANMADYVAAKYALYGLSKAMALEWAEDHIRVNMVSPGLTQTDLTQHYHDRIFRMEASRTPLKRIATPADIAGAVAFLLSDDSAFLTGSNLFVTGGQVMR